MDWLIICWLTSQVIVAAFILCNYKLFAFQYLGDKVSERVKVKVIEMLYSWTVSLPDEAKICEAYQMLKTQGESSVIHKQLWEYSDKV